MQAIETTDRTLLRRLLAPHPLRATYMLGDLDPSYFRFTRWFVAGPKADTPTGVAMLYDGLRLPLLLTHGDPASLEVALQEALPHLPERIFLQIEDAHEAIVGRWYGLERLRAMLRMGLHREAYRPPEIDRSQVVALGHQDTAAIMGLFRFYPDAFFEPYQLESKCYFGVRDRDELVAVAGVHIISEEFRVAALGNVLTHPEHRGKGLARACISRVLDSVFERVPCVGLNVLAENRRAQSTFASLGFEHHSDFLDGLAIQS